MKYPIKATAQRINKINIVETDSGERFLSLIKKVRLNPFYLLAITTFSIFLAEAFIMFLLSALPPLGHSLEMAFDAFLLTVLIFPMLYLFLFKPMISHIELRRKVEEELKEKSKELAELNKNLERRVREEIEKQMEQEQLLVQQSKLATMGEMISAIAHQWRQPINSLGIVIQDLECAYENGQIDKKYIDETVKKTLRLILFMSRTIDDFRAFLKPSREKTPFNVKLAVKEVLALTSMQLRHHKIFLRLRCGIEGCMYSSGKKHQIEGVFKTYACENCEQSVLGYPNEFKQVILNIIDNAKDAILEKRKESMEIENGKIAIEIYRENGRIFINIKDNGGGIKEEVLDRIFEPYFTTRAVYGTGIGLYISKVIIESHMGGKLYAKNENGSAIFTIAMNVMIDNPEDDGSTDYSQDLLSLLNGIPVRR
jgi:signal transduction histidine kinase